MVADLTHRLATGNDYDAMSDLMDLAIGEFDAIEPALYFSTSTFTTVGFGDLVLAEDWRMLAAAESANGFLLIGWSTAFLVAVTARVRIFEAEIGQSGEK